MKKLNYVLILCIFFTLNLYSKDYPTEKGVYTLGGHISFDCIIDNLKNFNLEFFPQIGYFTGRNFMIGFGGVFSYSSSSVFEPSMSIGGGPYTRIYFMDPSSKILPYLSCGFYILKEKLTGWDLSPKTTFYISPGLDFLISKNVAVEASIGLSGNIGSEFHPLLFFIIGLNNFIY